MRQEDEEKKLLFKYLFSFSFHLYIGNDLDTIRALFSEKEKELSVAVAKVEVLTRQLEDLRRDRRATQHISSDGGGAHSNPSIAALELDKLRKELMYRNQLSLQQDTRLHLQREALQQRQAELQSVDQRIQELQNRLNKKKASNQLLPAAAAAAASLSSAASPQLLQQYQQQLMQLHQLQQQPPSSSSSQPSVAAAASANHFNNIALQTLAKPPSIQTTHLK